MNKVDEATQTMIRNLEEKTGKSLAAWVQIVNKAKLAKHGEIVKFLKAEHELGHGYANLVAHEALQSAAGNSTEEDLLSAQYAGPKAVLLPIYEALVAAIQKFGDDIELSPKKAYVSVRRSKQFACLQPSTATRFDVGINLKGVSPEGRLEASGSFNTMVSHRVRLASVSDVDKELISWLRKAYEAA